MDTTSLPIRNDAVARQIMVAIASTHPFHVAPKIEDILNNAYPSRRPTAAARDGKGAARTGDKQTSIEAAHLVHVTNQQKIILRTLSFCGNPVSAATISQLSHLKLSSASTRMKALVVNGLVQELGFVIEEGRKKTTYRITAAGREWLAALHVN